MKKLINNILTKSKYNFVLVIAALLMLAVSLSAVTYCWIETSNSVDIMTSNAAGEEVKSVSDTNGTVDITVGSTGAVSLNRYIDNIDNLFLAPAKLNGTSLQILRDSGSYTNATTNDIGNNYIEFDVPFKVSQRAQFSFTDSSSITVGGAADNPVRVSVSVDGGTAKVFNSQLNSVDNNTDRAAFTVGNAVTSQHYMKVRIWLDTTNNNYANYEGNSVSVNLGLVPQKDDSVANLTVTSADYANVFAYLNGVAINLDTGVDAEPGSIVTVDVQTGCGMIIGSGDNLKLNGHEFNSMLANVDGISSAVAVTSTSTTDKITTTKITYTVPEDAKQITLTPTTKASEFHIGGIYMKLKDSSGSYTAITDDTWGTSVDMTYNENLNCVSAVIQNTSSSAFKSKIATGANFTADYRDNINYTVLSYIDTSTQFFTNGLTNAQITKTSGDADEHKYITYTAPTATDVLVVYYLDKNIIELNTDTTLTETLTATAASSTANGTATVNAGSAYDSTTAASSISIKRNSADRAVTFHAEANTGYKFVGWSTVANGTEYVSTSADYTVNLLADTTLYANYKKAVTVTLHTTGINVSNIQAVDYATKESIDFSSGSAVVLEGTQIDFTAPLPNTNNGYKLSWNVTGGEETSASVYISPGAANPNITYLVDADGAGISADTTVNVAYEKLMKLTISPTGGTVASVTNAAIALSGNTAYFESGTATTITATSSDTGYYKVNWSGSGTQEKVLTADNTTKKTDTFNIASITADTTVSVTFTKLYKVNFALDASSITGSAVTASAGAVTNLVSGNFQPAGTEIAFTASCTDTTKDITADWTITYGKNTTGATATNTLTHTETVSDANGDITVTVLVKEKVAKTIYLVDPNGTFSSSNPPKIWWWNADASNTESSTVKLAENHFTWANRPTMTLVSGYSNVWSYTLPDDCSGHVYCADNANWFMFTNASDGKGQPEYYLSDLTNNMYNIATKTWSKFPPSKRNVALQLVDNAVATVTCSGYTIAEGESLDLVVGTEITLNATLDSGYSLTSFEIINSSDNSVVQTFTANNSKYTISDATPTNITIKTTVEKASPYKTFYFKNTANWSVVYAHIWDSTSGGNGNLTSWPGNQIAKLTDNIYSVTVDTSKYNSIIFDSGNGGSQTGNLTLPTNSNRLFTWDTTKTNMGSWSDYTPSSTTKNIYFKNNASWSTVYAHIWKNGSSTTFTTWNSSLYGANMTLVDSTNKIYCITVDTSQVDKIIFNNGSAQTATLNISTSYNLYTCNSASSGSWSSTTSYPTLYN